RLRGAVVNGKLVASNLGSNSQCWVIDVDAFKKAGVELPPPTWTWADFERIALALREKLGVWGMGSGLWIILPLIRPALITATIFSFYWTWEDFLTPLVYLNEPKLYTISVALRSFADPSAATDWGAIFAMSALSLVPVFLV